MAKADATSWGARVPQSSYTKDPQEVLGEPRMATRRILQGGHPDALIAQGRQAEGATRGIGVTQEAWGAAGPTDQTDQGGSGGFAAIYRAIC